MNSCINSVQDDISHTFSVSLLFSIDSRGASYCARSALPIGAGLGSSASYASCIAAAFLQLFDHLVVHNAPGPVADAPYPGHKGLTPAQTDLVNGWAFLAEKVIHGNPSGIDNAVAVKGGALKFSRPMNGNPGGMHGLHGFKSIRFLLTDTRVPRSTKQLVAGVAAKMQADPADGRRVMSSIQAIADDATRLLTSESVSRDQLIQGLAVSVFMIFSRRIIKSGPADNDCSCCGLI